MIMRPCYFWPFPLREMSVLMRCRANMTFCALLIFEKSGEPSPFLGNAPSPDGAVTTADAGADAAVVVPWPRRG
jgi:hypothetical protein